MSPSEMRHGSGSRAFEGEGLYNMQLLVYQPLSQLVYYDWTSDRPQAALAHRFMAEDLGKHTKRCR